jgi:hypothetical protein
VAVHVIVAAAGGGLGWNATDASRQGHKGRPRRRSSERRYRHHPERERKPPRPHRNCWDIPAREDIRHAVDVVGVDQGLLARGQMLQDRRRAQPGEDLFQIEHAAAAHSADLVERRLAVDLLLEDIELNLVVGLPPRSERHQALVEPHAVLDGGPRVEVVVAMARDHLDEALSLLQGVDDRCPTHAEHAEVRALLPGLEDEALHEPFALRHLGPSLALFRVVDLVHDDEVDDVAIQKGDELLLRAGLLELLVVEHQISRRRPWLVAPLGIPGLLGDLGRREGNLDLLIPGVDNRIRTTDHREGGARDAGGDDRAQGLAGAHPGPVAEPPIVAHGDGHPTLHEVRRGHRSTGAWAEGIPGRRLERFSLVELGQEPIANQSRVDIPVERSRLLAGLSRSDVGVAPELCLRAVEQQLSPPPLWSFARRIEQR